MKKRSTLPIEEFRARADREQPDLAAHSAGKALVVAAIVLLVALILMAEGRLPPEVRLGLFEAAYAYP